MKIALAAGLLSVVHAAAVPVSSTTSVSSTSVKAAGRQGFGNPTPVAAEDTNVTIEDLGITPSILQIPVKPNPNFTPNVTNAVAIAQAKYVIVEERLQQEKRALLERSLREEQELFQDLHKRGRAGFGTTAAAGRAGFAAAGAQANPAATKLNLPCAFFPLFCKSTTTTAATTSKMTTTSAKVTTTTSVKTTSSTTSTAAKTTSTSIKTTTSVAPTTTSIKTTTTTSMMPTTTTLAKTTSTSSKAPSTTLLTLSAENIQLDSEFLSEVSLGSNNNVLDMVLDTGSADLWMFSTDCIGCSSNHDFYDPSKSTTFVNTTTKFALQYGDGSTTSGLLGFDTVTIAGAPIQAQSIDVAHQISASLQSNAMDGILGLGFPSLMSTQNMAGVTTPITNMVNQKLIPTGKFGLQYIKTNHWSYAGGGGAWTFGGYDTSVVSGAINTVPLVNAQYWMISMSQVSVGSAYSYTPTQNVIVDSGTTLILLDAQSVANIHAYLPGGRVDPTGSHYQIFCNATDPAYAGTRNAYFTIGGQKYGVPARDLAWYPESATPGYCYSGIQPWRNSFGILGVMFLKNVYAVFDQTNSAFGLGVRTDIAPLTD